VVIFEKSDIRAGKNCNTTVIAELGERDERAGTEVVKNEGRLGRIAEEGGQGEDTGVCGAHDRTVGRQDRGAIGNGNSALKVHCVSTSDERGSGARIENNSW
jgi:hypothetical protein